MLSVFEWFGLVLQRGAFVVIALPDEPKQNQGRGLVDRKLGEAPHKSGSSIWFFCGFLDLVCGYLLFFLSDTKNKKIENM